MLVCEIPSSNPDGGLTNNTTHCHRRKQTLPLDQIDNPNWVYRRLKGRWQRWRGEDNRGPRRRHSRRSSRMAERVDRRGPSPPRELETCNTARRGSANKQIPKTIGMSRFQTIPYDMSIFIEYTLIPWHSMLIWYYNSSKDFSAPKNKSLIWLRPHTYQGGLDLVPWCHAGFSLASCKLSLISCWLFSFLFRSME